MASFRHGNVFDPSIIDRKDQCIRIPEHSRQHPIIPERYVQEWKQDIVTRNHTLQNADLGGVPNYEHDDSLFLKKREQLHYNVEERSRVMDQYVIPNREVMQRPPKHHHSSKMQSSLMYYK